MEIKTGQAHSEPENPAVMVPPDRGRSGRKKIAQKQQRSKPLGARLLTLLKVLAVVSLFALVAMAAFSVHRYAYSTGLLTLRTVSVEGCRHSDAGTVESIVRREFLVNILRIDLKQLRSRLEQEPWIRRVEVRRILPSTLKIKVQERVPTVIAEIGGNLELLDNEGFLLDHYDTAYGKMDAPVFTGLRGDDAASYKVLQEDNSSRVRIGVQVLAELAAGSPDFTRALSEVDLSDPANVKVLLVDDTAEVFLGDRDFLRRFQMFMSNLPQYRDLKAQGKDIAAVDLRFDSQIVYRLRHPVAEQAEAKPKTSRNH
jgi:cell division protein FtsQ